MKKFAFLFFLIFTYTVFAQVGYVETTNKVYRFLDRMKTLGLLENYDAFELPKKRTEIAKYLSELKNIENELEPNDKRKLEFFLTEFSFEINKTTKKFSSLFQNSRNYFSSESLKYLFFFTDTSTGSVFANFLGGISYIVKNKNSGTASAFPYTFGGKIRFTYSKNFGAEIKATNGSFFGQKSVLLDESPFKYNYKFTESAEDNSGANYFDETAGYFTYQSNYADFKIGRDRLNFGYGIKKTIFGNNSPLFDYFSLNLNYKRFHFSFVHGKLLGKSTVVEITGASRKTLNDKWIGYHRFSLDITRGTQIGAGETVIYYGRAIDLSYLNPFNFYKSSEHANQDRDNSMLFFDFKTTDLIENIGLYATWIIDDMDFTKLGTDWYGNNFLWDFGIDFIPNFLPSDIIKFQTVLINPYFYTHKFYDNNFTNLGFNIADNFEPNSFNLILQYSFSVNRDWDFTVGYLFENHGANKYDANGNLLENYGGSILEGHRAGDSEYVKYLSGVKEISHHLSIQTLYEFNRGYVLFGKLLYSKFINNTNLSLYLGINVKI